MVDEVGMDSEVDPATRRKAQRHLVILYVVMFVLVALPIVLWWIRTR